MMKKKLNPRTKYLVSEVNKIIIFALILSLSLGTFGVQSTNAFYNDTESSAGNSFSAGSLVLATSSDDLGPVDLGVLQNYSVINQGSLPFEYEMTVGISGGSDTTFCGQLNIIVLKGADTLYTGSLSGLDFIKLIEGAQDDLTFTITDSHSPANGAGKVCSFNLISKAWQEELDYSQGFNDTASTKAVVYSAGTIIPPLSNGVVLNEFLPNPNGVEYGFDFGADGDSMPKGEWIELYNNSNASVDLTGWYIKDLADHTINITSTNTQPTTVTILAHKWLVVYMNGEILNNTGPETITLYNNLNISQNSYSYDGGTYCDMQPTPNDNNDTNPSGHCSSVPGNKSYARIPDGVGAWVDPIPTPGMPNELASEIIPEEPVVVVLDSVVPETPVISEVPVVSEAETLPAEEEVIPESVSEEAMPEVTEEVVIEQPIEKSIEAVVEEIVAAVVSVVETPTVTESAPTE